jgi:hypothetical protein
MQKQIVAMAVLVVLLALGVFMLSKQDQQKKAGLLNVPLISYDMHAPSNINEHAVASTGGMGNAQQDVIQSITLLKGNEVLLDAFQADGAWLSSHLSEETPYPLNVDALSGLVRDLLSAQIIEKKSAKASQHARLGLLSVDAQDAVSVLVRISSSKHQIEVLLGNDARHTLGQYVRFNDQDQMLLINKQIMLPADKYAWLNPELFSLEQEDILSVTRVDKLISADKIQKTPQIQDAQWQIIRMPKGEWSLKDMPANSALAYESVLSNYLSTLTALSFDAVEPIQVNALMQVLLELHIETPAHSSDISHKHILRLVRLDEGNSNKSDLFLQIEGKGEFMRFNDWQYRIPEYQIEELIKSQQDFIGTE